MGCCRSNSEVSELNIDERKHIDLQEQVKNPSVQINRSSSAYMTFDVVPPS